MHDAAIIASNLKILRGKVWALHGISLQIVPGTITGLIGPSGSGKTTLMRAIVGTQQLTAGSLQVLGLPAGSKALRAKIGYVTQSPAIYDDLTVQQNLRYFAAILGLNAAAAAKAIAAVDLQGQRDQLAGSLSGGQRARVSLAVSLLDEPPLLVLDEPTVGLDPVLREHLWELFARLANEGRTLLISSHVMDEAEKCPQLLLLRAGAVLYQGTKANLLHTSKTASVQDAFLRLAGGAS